MISGICAVCSKAGAVHTCFLCGRQVCASHFDATRNICVSCRGGKKMLKDKVY